MKRMITEKQISFFDDYANCGAINKYYGAVLAVNYLSEYPGIKNLSGYLSRASIHPWNQSKLNLNLNGAIASADRAFTNFTCNNFTIENAKLIDMYFSFYEANVKYLVLKNIEIAGNMNGAFQSGNIISITGGADVSGITNAYEAFKGAHALAQLELKHWRVDFDISASTAFTTKALVEIISNLDDTGSAHTLAMGATNLAKLSEAQKKVATDKGWNLA